MGTIINARREPGQPYQYCKLYEATVVPSIGGWGVRTRDAYAQAGNTICLRYAITRGTILSTVSFMVNGLGIADPKNLYIGVWGNSATVNPTRYYRVAGSVIDVNDIGGDWADTVGVVTTVSIDPILVELPGGPLDMRYFLSFTCENLTLEGGDTTTGSGMQYGGLISNINDMTTPLTYIDVAEFTDDEEATSIEAWGVVNKWTRIELGGTIEEESDEYQTAGTYSGDWVNIENAFVDDAAVARATGTLYIDLGAGIDPAVNWNDIVAGGTTAYLEFPDYDVYGVRALSRLIIKGTIMDATDEITIMYCDQDTSSIPGPAAGWENLTTISGAGAISPEEYVIPQIARWLKLVQTTGNAAFDEISFIQIMQIGYPVEDGKFTVDHSQLIHRFWVDNYPVSDEVYKLQVANMAGAESEASTEFTNRINKD